MKAVIVLRQMLRDRLEKEGRDWLEACAQGVADDISDASFAAMFSKASRYARDRDLLEPDEDELVAAARAFKGWNPERWTVLEALRVCLLLSRTDLAEEEGALAIERLFEYADESELRPLYRSLALLPAPERFSWRAGEGCRTNMTSVFECVALDTPYPAEHFDDLAFRQAAIKAIFVGAPLWRLQGLDQRLSAELARMALDVADERRSAGRPVQPDLWLCLGQHGGERGLAALLVELDPANTNVAGRCAAAYGLARAHADDELARLVESEQDTEVRAAMQDALEGNTAQTAFQAFEKD